jgi:hypothetical protein
VCFKVLQVIGVVGDLVELSFAAILNVHRTNEGYRKTDAKLSDMLNEQHAGIAY